MCLIVAIKDLPISAQDVAKIFNKSSTARVFCNAGHKIIKFRNDSDALEFCDLLVEAYTLIFESSKFKIEELMPLLNNIRLRYDILIANAVSVS